MTRQNQNREFRTVLEELRTVEPVAPIRYLEASDIITRPGAELRTEAYRIAERRAIIGYDEFIQDMRICRDCDPITMGDIWESYRRTARKEVAHELRAVRKVRAKPLRVRVAYVARFTGTLYPLHAIRNALYR